MSEEKKSFASQLWGCLVHPMNAFESIEEADLRRGVAIILVIAFLSALAGYNYGSKMSFRIFDRQIVVANIFAISNGLGVVIGWLFPTVLLHLFSSLSTDGGGLRRILALTCFASLPLVFRHGLRLVDSYTISVEYVLNIASMGVTNGNLVNRLLNQGLRFLNVFSLWSLALAAISVMVNYNACRR